MARLPNPGSDQGTWGDILNEFLQVAHNSDGTLQPISNASLADGTITSSKLVNGTITGAKIANNTITDSNIAAANIDGDAATPSLRTLGTGANQAMPGNAAVTPSAHADSHKGDGADPIAVATTTISGLMSNTDKDKLDDIADNATANSSDAFLLARANHTGFQTLSTISDITASASELNILDGATLSTTELNYVDGVTSAIQGQIDGKQPADGDLTDISVLTPSDNDVMQRKSGEWTNRTPAQLKLDLGLISSDVGLGNVDNTSDANKPVSTATQSALDGKESAFTKGNLVAGSNVTLDGTLSNRLVGSGDVTVNAVGSGDVVGPASSTDNAVVRFDGTTGKLLESNNNVTINDSGVLRATTLWSNIITSTNHGTRLDLWSHAWTTHANTDPAVRMFSGGITPTNTGTWRGLELVPSFGPATTSDWTVFRVNPVADNGGATRLLADFAVGGASRVTIDSAGNITTAGTVDSRDIATDGARLDDITDADYLNSNTTKADVGLGNVDDTSDATKNSATTTLANKRITKRVVTVAQSATPTSNTDDADVFSMTGLTQAVTDMSANQTGVPVDGDTLIWRITDDGTGRALAWGALYEHGGLVALPNTTVASTMLVVGFIWNTATTKWRCVAVA